MSIKGLLKTNIPQTILVLFLYLIYAIAGTLGTYLFKYSLNAITAKNLNSFIFWEIITMVTELATALLLPLATVAFTRQIQDYLHQIRKDIMHHYYNGDDEKISTMQNDLTNNLKILSTDFASHTVDYHLQRLTFNHFLNWYPIQNELDSNSNNCSFGSDYFIIT